jgi:signal transduction histidine kinase
VSLRIGSVPGLAVEVDPAELEAAILNLALNARDAMADGGTLAIGLEAVELAAGNAQGLPAGRIVEIAVSDTGSGIPEDALERVFEPFFTTKEPGRGTGLGLPISARLVEKFGGSMSIECPESGGTIVTVALPAARYGAEIALEAM